MRRLTSLYEYRGRYMYRYMYMQCDRKCYKDIIAVRVCTDPNTETQHTPPAPAQQLLSAQLSSVVFIC